MKNVTTLSDVELLRATRAQARRCNEADADLLVLLGEISERRLFLEYACKGLHEFCVRELGMSDDVAYSRKHGALIAREFPIVLDYVRDGRLHLTGLRLLGPHLTSENVERVLAEAANKTKAQIEYFIAATLAPKPDVPTTVRKLPTPAAPPAPPPPAEPRTEPTPEPAPVLTLSPPPPPRRRDEVSPLSAASYRVSFTASAALKAKLDEALELLGHSVAKDDVAAVFERALDLLIPEVKKKKFGLVAKPRSTVEQAQAAKKHAHRPAAAMRRHIYVRDGGQCTWVGPDGQRCPEKRCLEYDHQDGWARVKRNDVDRIFLRCRAHNQHAADKMYSRAFMQAKRDHTFSSRDGNSELLF